MKLRRSQKRIEGVDDQARKLYKEELRRSQKRIEGYAKSAPLRQPLCHRKKISKENWRSNSIFSVERGRWTEFEKISKENWRRQMIDMYKQKRKKSLVKISKENWRLLCQVGRLTRRGGRGRSQKRIEGNYWPSRRVRQSTGTTKISKENWRIIPISTTMSFTKPAKISKENWRINAVSGRKDPDLHWHGRSQKRIEGAYLLECANHHAYHPWGRSQKRIEGTQRHCTWGCGVGWRSQKRIEGGPFRILGRLAVIMKISKENWRITVKHLTLSNLNEHV